MAHKDAPKKAKSWLADRYKYKFEIIIHYLAIKLEPCHSETAFINGNVIWHKSITYWEISKFLVYKRSSADLDGKILCV